MKSSEEINERTYAQGREDPPQEESEKEGEAQPDNQAKKTQDEIVSTLREVVPVIHRFKKGPADMDEEQ